VTDQTGKTATSSVNMTVDPLKVIGLPPAEAYAVIAGIIIGIAAVAIATVVLFQKRKGHSNSTK
jgi:hypothetical protein